ncbi:plasmid recombination protein [Peribacillus sp. NPDC006672]|uniref:plasmid recombination protein n=1 Tax=Peribacillus sp. NPDC006672 TaxID=3390606 RepID=UPI003D027334
MSYSIFRVEKVKSENATRAIQRHNQRGNKTYGNQDIDHSRTHLNYTLELNFSAIVRVIPQNRKRYTSAIRNNK